MNIGYVLYEQLEAYAKTIQQSDISRKHDKQNRAATTQLLLHPGSQKL
jgi:hypothetical protein